MSDGLGLFITFEGGEGAGKTTQISLLAEHIKNEHNLDVLLTREPGGTPEAEKIRDLLVKRDGGNWTAEAEILLLFAARHMHVENVIRPALAKGHIVLCDRFTDSTRAYQSYGHGLDIGIIEQVNSVILNNFEPELTILIDVPVKVGLERAGKRISDDGSSEDRFESLDISFHERMHAGFLEIAKDHKNRCFIADGMKSIEDLSADIIAEFDRRYNCDE